MESRYYKQLIENYFEGLTTLEQEKLLKDFLSQYKDEDPLFLEVQKIFKSLDQLNQEVCNIDFEEIIKESTHGSDETNHVFQDIKIINDKISGKGYEKKVQENKGNKLRQLWKYSGSVAAAAILFIAVFYLFNLTKTPIVYAYVNGQPITDKEQAMKYSEQAWHTLAKPLAKGTTQLKHIDNLNKPAKLLTVQK